MATDQSACVALDEDGYIDVKIGGVEASVDLYQANNKIYELNRKHEGNANEFHKELREYLLSLGFPSCSDRLADKFAAAVINRVTDLKKKDGDEPKPDSPDSTASTPSN